MSTMSPTGVMCHVQSALEATIGDEKAFPLLEEAEKKFLETSAHGVYPSLPFLRHAYTPG